MSLSIHSFRFNSEQSLSFGSARLNYRLFGWLSFCIPTFITLSLFISRLSLTYFTFFIPFIKVHHYIINPHKVNILSEYLHNHELPIDKTSFPASLKLFFATGNIEPP